ncbi:AMY1.1, partial [Symbiodinium microadriaticum]
MAASRIEGFRGFWALRFPGTRKLEQRTRNGGNDCARGCASAGTSGSEGSSELLLVEAPQLTGDALEMAKEAHVHTCTAQGMQGMQGVCSAQGGIVFLFQSRWAKPRLHYRPSEAEPWTSPPGEAMEPSGLDGFPHRDGWWALRLPTAQALECVPNDGGSQWHKVRGGNCHIPGPGAWTLMGESLQKLGQAATAPVTAGPPAPAVAVAEASDSSAPPVALESASEGLRLLEMLEGKNVVLLYRSAWASPHLHCRELTDQGTAGTWSQLPGLPFAASAAAEDLEGAGELFVARLPAKVRGLEFVLNDGGPHYRWDKAAGGGNFRIPPKSEGVWLVSGGRLEKLQPPPSPSDAPAVTAVTRTSVALSWRPAASSVKGYRLFRNGKQVASLASAVLQFTDSGLLAAHEYTYALAAVSTQ